ncbi:MAG: hypothetical protein GXX84_18860 [Acidobacteria bacterium]|nr:hypothetical protein [Acidobacteriota bacterium]
MWREQPREGFEEHEARFLLKCERYGHVEKWCNATTVQSLPADVIVFAHQLGIWQKLKNAYEVHVPAIVIEEARQEAAGEIKRLEAAVHDISDTFKDFDPSFLAALHDGEKEGIAIVRNESDSGMVFCTGDIAAIESVGMLGLASACMSFEEVLQRARLSVPRLPNHLTKKAHDCHFEVGIVRRTTGECFQNPPLSI